ncbi:MAG: AAA family ATPase [Herbinix sp.]|nr:AAA family ATPase [Herbinix sp.]
MKLLKITLEGLPLYNDILVIDFVAQQRVDDDDKERLYNVFSNIYLNQAISFVGINASGKTTILKTISFVLKMLNNKSINDVKTKEILNDLDSNSHVIITSYFCDDFLINKLETFIRKEVSSIDGNERFVIYNENLWSKEIRRIKLKKSIFDFKDSDLKKKRDQNEQYLMDDVSIIVALNKKNDMGFFVRDMLEFTDHNMINVLGRFPRELLTFLDPSIEYLECRFKEKKVDIRLKFYGKEEVAISNTMTLSDYLSSGTIKGLGVFMSALFTFTEGGYLIIDEIENHFNREIVATLIRFYMDSKVNKTGATLIFSTHYSELLDEFHRNDSVYIVRNKEGIIANNLANVLKRNDLKKSEVYDSDYLGGTVPEYDVYMALKKALISAK